MFLSYIGFGIPFKLGSLAPFFLYSLDLGLPEGSDEHRVKDQECSLYW